MTNSTTAISAGKDRVLDRARKYKQKQRIPLTVHPGGTWGRWCKKINGKQWHFGPIVPDAKDFGSGAALEKYHREKDARKGGREPRTDANDDATIRDLCNAFLVAKDDLLATGEITSRTRADYERTTDRIVECFGRERVLTDLGADDFGRLRKHLAKTLGPVALGNEIARARVVFKYAFDAELIDKPLRYGPNFKRPSRRVLRQHRQKNGKRMFSPEEIHLLLNAAGTQMRAMILLACNTGFGNADMGLLPLGALDLAGGWVDFPRPKTAVARRVPLWPETIDAIEAYLAKRPAPKDPALADRVFVTKYGGAWYKPTSDNPVSAEFAKLMDAVDADRAKEAKKKRRRAPDVIHRRGMGFYSFRHLFQTVGDGARDPIATRFIMGHAEAANDMSAVYREGVDDDRLRAVTEHVRCWLWPDEGKIGKTE